MKDRELLELAAKAARIEYVWDETLSRLIPIVNGYPQHHWNPLTDHGDNRRLQIALLLGLVPVEGGGWACVAWFDQEETTLAVDDDPNLAIVRAAAAIAAEKREAQR